MSKEIPTFHLVRNAILSLHNKTALLHNKWLASNVLMNLRKDKRLLPVDLSKHSFNAAMGKAFLNIHHKVNDHIVTH